MVDIKQQQYQTIISVLTTELNSLASGSAATASAAKGSDTTDAEVLLDFELTCGSFTPGTSPRADLYLLRSADGTNYEDATTGASESLPPDAFAGSFVPTSGASAKIMILRDIPAPPGLWKAVLHSELGATLPSSGNTLDARPHSFQTA